MKITLNKKTKLKSVCQLSQICKIYFLNVNNPPIAVNIYKWMLNVHCLSFGKKSYFEWVFNKKFN